MQDTSKEFHFQDFTTTHYADLLSVAKKNYVFRFYDGFDKDENFILWRHDLDYSIQRAYRLAVIESEAGVGSTFLIHLHNEYYNFFESDIHLLMKKILDLGHRLGLHFDTHFYGINSETDLTENLVFERRLLEKLYGAINVFSFHNTTPFTMGCKAWEYAGLINTYADYFQKNVEYCSDSNGYWRFKRLMDVLEKAAAPSIQVLTHPEWWQEEVMSPWQRIQRSIDGRASRNKNYYQQHLRKFGMKNIDWNGIID